MKYLFWLVEKQNVDSPHMGHTGAKIRRLQLFITVIKNEKVALRQNCACAMCYVLSDVLCAMCYVLSLVLSGSASAMCCACACACTVTCTCTCTCKL